MASAEQQPLTPNDRARTAATSIANRIPSKRSQIRPTISSAAVIDATGTPRSPTPNGSRLVANTVTVEHSA